MRPHHVRVVHPPPRLRLPLEPPEEPPPLQQVRVHHLQRHPPPLLPLRQVHRPHRPRPERPHQPVRPDLRARRRLGHGFPRAPCRSGPAAPPGVEAFATSGVPSRGARCRDRTTTPAAAPSAEQRTHGGVRTPRSGCRSEGPVAGAPSPAQAPRDSRPTGPGRIVGPGAGRPCATPPGHGRRSGPGGSSSPAPSEGPVKRRVRRVSHRANRISSISSVDARGFWAALASRNRAPSPPSNASV